MSGPAGTGEAEELRLARPLAGQLLVGSLRLGLGLLGLVAATLRGLQGDRAVAAFALGAFGFLVAWKRREASGRPQGHVRSGHAAKRWC